LYTIPNVYRSQLEFFNGNIELLYNKYVPLRTKIIKPNENPWTSMEIKTIIHACDRAYRKWKRYKTDYLLKQYSSLRIKVNKSCWLAKKKFNNVSSGKEFWKNIKSIWVKKQREETACHINANELNITFVKCQPEVPDQTNNPYLNTLPNKNCDTSFSFVCVSQCDVQCTVYSPC